jgi:hypothetical protein
MIQKLFKLLIHTGQCHTFWRMTEMFLSLREKKLLKYAFQGSNFTLYVYNIYYLLNLINLLHLC